MIILKVIRPENGCNISGYLLHYAGYGIAIFVFGLAAIAIHLNPVMPLTKVAYAENPGKPRQDTSLAWGAIIFSILVV